MTGNQPIPDRACQGHAVNVDREDVVRMLPPPGQAPSQSTLALARRHQPKCASSTNKGAHEHTQGKAKPENRKRKNPRHHWTQSEVSSLSVAVRSHESVLG